ncbi:tRNA lysidine(34) synthetase TilS [Iodidimonas sp. SYSU 1G8]|uniref:tRNA lysidine(34) synthetase TilS n=1 Tax=Iodidimonas sp. SYSU 1G8 TaxID=3133967 RepID=UPI0031FF36D3
MNGLPRLDGVASLCVAVSGGADSMALALLARDWAASRGISLTALTVDHGLRPEAAAEAIQVGDWMAAACIGHETLAWRETPRGNVQAAARRARYALLDEWCAARGVPILLIAHHLEDQAETVLLRLGRGSGVHGLAGMAPETAPPWPGAPSRLRPLLDVPRARLVATLRARGQAWIEDPSNADRRYARVRARGAWPHLAALGITPARLAATARAMARARAVLDDQVHDWLARTCRFDSGGYAVLAYPVPKETRDETGLRALAFILMAVGGADYAPRLDALERLWGRIKRGDIGAATLGGCRLISSGDGLLVVRETRGMQGALRIGPNPVLWDGRFAASGEGLSIDRLRPGGLAVLRAALPERVVRSVPAAARGVLPAFYDDQGLVAVPSLGYRRPGSVSVAPMLEFLAARDLPPNCFGTDRMVLV